MKYIGYIEISVGVGLGLGPTIGSVVFKFLGYEDTMYFFGGLNFLALVICCSLIPGALNETLTEEELDEIEHEKMEILTIRTQ